MHKFAEEIAECLKTKVKAVGIDNIEGKDLEELKTWSEIISKMVCYDKDFKIVEAMEEEKDNEKTMNMYRKYSEDDYPENDMKYYDHYRYQNGRFAPKGSGTYRRYYDGNSMYRMNNDDYKMWSSRDEEERMRDMDRDMGRMYYEDLSPMPGNTSPRHRGNIYYYGGENGNGNMNGNYRNYREGRSGISRRTYIESKEKGEEKTEKLNKLDKYLEELKEDMKEMVSGMTDEEKTMWKNRLTSMASTM